MTRMIVAALVLALATRVSAQGSTTTNPSAGELLHALVYGSGQSRGIVAEIAADVLAGKRPGYSQQARDSLEAGLLEVALHRTDNIVASAVTALGVAGNPRYRTPFSRSLPDLQRIFREARDPGVRAVALGAVHALADQPGVLAFWRRVATAGDPNDGPFAQRAIEHLAAHGPAGIAVLRDIHARHQVQDPRARWYLEALATRNYAPPR